MAIKFGCPAPASGRLATYEHRPAAAQCGRSAVPLPRHGPRGADGERRLSDSATNTANSTKLQVPELEPRLFHHAFEQFVRIEFRHLGQCANRRAHQGMIEHRIGESTQLP